MFGEVVIKNVHIKSLVGESASVTFDGGKWRLILGQKLLVKRLVVNSKSSVIGQIVQLGHDT